MIKKTKGLQVWMHLPATLNRRLMLLNSPLHSCSVLFLKQLKTAKSLGVDALVLPINWRAVALHGPTILESVLSLLRDKECINVRWVLKFREFIGK